MLPQGCDPKHVPSMCLACPACPIPAVLVPNFVYAQVMETVTIWRRQSQLQAASSWKRAPGSWEGVPCCGHPLLSTCVLVHCRNTLCTCRDKPADIVVPVPTVSGRHAQLKVGEFCLLFHADDSILLRCERPAPAHSAEGSKVQVTDLGSTNGTFVNDQELTADKTVDLAVGTEVTFGGYSGSRGRQCWPMRRSLRLWLVPCRR